MTASTESVWTSRALTTTSVSALRATGKENKWFLVFKRFQSKSRNIFSGKRCEYLTSLSFLHNTSYVELEPLNVKPGESIKKIKVKYFLSTLQPEIFSAANVTITFATEQPDGVLFYFGDYQHLAVELFKWVKYFLSKWNIFYRHLLQTRCRNTDQSRITANLLT